MPAERKNKIAALTAEWADGDAVAISIGLGCDYFCTKDEAKSAGQKSVLSGANRAWLFSEYGFKAITPDELAAILPSMQE